MALVLSMFESGDRVKAMGWWSMVGAGGPVLGVAVGGFIIQSIGWRAMFLLEMVLGAVALVLAVAVLPEHGAGQRLTRGRGRASTYLERFLSLLRWGACSSLSTVRLSWDSADTSSSEPSRLRRSPGSCS